MAIPISTIPVLKGEEAKKFYLKAKRNISKKGTIDFKKQFRISSEILKKAKLA